MHKLDFCSIIVMFVLTRYGNYHKNGRPILQEKISLMEPLIPPPPLKL